MAPKSKSKTVVQVYATDSRDSLIDYLDGGQPPTTRSRRRACPILGLLGLLAHFVISGSGIALSVLTVHFKLQGATVGSWGLIARILLFAASCMGIFYVVMHACAARENYVRGYATAQVFEYFTVGLAVLIMRLGLPVWIGAVALAALAAAKKGFNAAEGIRGNVVWVQLGIAVLGLITLVLMVVATETTERPFATTLLSRQSFIRGSDERTDGRVDTFDLSVSRAGMRPTAAQKRRSSDDEGEAGLTEREMKQMGFDRSTINTPESPVEPPNNGLLHPGRPTGPESTALTRVRSQPVPSPLQAVFTSAGMPPDAQDSPRKNGAHMAWRPPPTTADQTQERQRPRAPTATTVASGLPTNPRQSRASAPRPPSSRYSDGLVLSMPQQIVPVSRFSDTDIMTPISPSDTVDTELQSGLPRGSTLTIANPDPDPEPEPQAMPLPNLAKLLGQLSTRAAARRRINNADLPPPARTSSEAPRTGSAADMAAVLFDQPSASINAPPQPASSPASPTAPASAPGPLPRRASLLVRQFDLTARQSIDITALDGFQTSELVDIPRPENAPRDMLSTAAAADDDDDDDDNPPPPLVRSATAAPRLVRNFSRPGTAVRPRTAGGGGSGDADHQPTDFAQHVGAAVDDRGRERGRAGRAAAAAAVRTSRSLPPAAANRTALVEDGSPLQRNQPMLLLADSPSPPPPPPPLLEQQSSKSASAAKPVSRFSAFPNPPAAAHVSSVGLAKVRGLGQGSTRRLDERVAMWRSGVRVVDGDDGGGGGESSGRGRSSVEIISGRTVQEPSEDVARVVVRRNRDEMSREDSSAARSASGVARNF